ncbi:killer cell lectin-like receptor 2 [Carlito syrichta]|uniref:Killer cell lectin-like receptor 2 n=1 Tax=Carlito syrichta TaxID=1868482 RepID=A0A1U7TTE3_CARSF|nr:killer cell lectin-like receptor 2 [Carlito syrichta]
MSDQGVIYATPRFFQTSSESQNRSRLDGTQRPGKTHDKEFSVPWRLIAVTLGILCLFLLMTVTVLVTKIFQYIREKHQQQELLGNLSQRYHIIQNDYLKEQFLTNKTLEYDIFKSETFQRKKKLDSLFTRKNHRHRKNAIFSKSLQNTGKLYEDQWSCCGVNCYYFTMENNNWKGCKQICQSYRSSLLKIDDEDELAFLQPQTYKNNYWIGLSYDVRESKWKWIDNGTSSGINSTIMSLLSGKGDCAFLAATRIATIDCLKTYNCICEKRIDCIFPAPTCTKNGR